MRNVIAIVTVVLAVVPSTGRADQFDYLAAGFSQEIYTGPLVGGPGMAWTGSGNLLTRNGSTIIEYSPTQNATYQGAPTPATPIHAAIANHVIPGLSSSGYGLAKGTDGYIYTPTAAGLERFSATFAGSAQLLPGTAGGQGYGVTTLPDGRIVYVAGASTNEVHVYNPSSGLDSLIYTAPSLIDDIEASATGAIALALQPISALTIISNTGSVINSMTGLAHHPDGLAFGDGVSANWLYSNNNDGSITQYQLGAGYSGTPVITDIALQTLPSGKAYGDLAAVGPDCAFYVTQFENGGLNGSTPGTGTHWDNGVTTNEPSIIRIAAVGPDGSEICGFGVAPEPSSIVLLGMGALAMLRRKRQ